MLESFLPYIPLLGAHFRPVLELPWGLQSHCPEAAWKFPEGRESVFHFCNPPVPSTLVYSVHSQYWLNEWMNRSIKKAFVVVVASLPGNLSH